MTEESPTEGELSAIAKREATIERLDRELAEAQANITNLQSQLSAANDQNVQAQATAQATLQKQQEDSKAQLDDLQKKLDAALAQSDIARQRAAALEADNARLTNASTAASTQTADVSRILASLQELDHRREVYLTSILRRYRDITSDFRDMGSMPRYEPRPESRCQRRGVRWRRPEPHPERRELGRGRLAPDQRAECNRSAEITETTSEKIRG